MSHCLIGLGANLGDRRENLQRAVDRLTTQPQVGLYRVSRWIETRPVGGPANQPAYLNGAAVIETSLAPKSLLALLQEIESELGRRRRATWEARPIDLDLLLYEDHVEQSDALIVPHPRMAWRRFVLEPAAEVAGPMVHPTIGWSIARLLSHLNTTPLYMAITGVNLRENIRFARYVADTCSADLLSGLPSPDDSERDFVAKLSMRMWFRGERFPADPSGREPGIALKCLRHRAPLLSVHNPCWSSSERFTVSDFWFNESRAQAMCRPPACGSTLLFRVWSRFESRVVRPRLIVSIEDSAKKRRFDEPLRQALARQLRRADTGPVLRIVEPCSREALDEVAAAVQAMR